MARCLTPFPSPVIEQIDKKSQVLPHRTLITKDMLTLLSCKVVAMENFIWFDNYWLPCGLVRKILASPLIELEFNLKVVDNLSAQESGVSNVVGFPLKFLTITNK